MVGLKEILSHSLIWIFLYTYFFGSRRATIFDNLTGSILGLSEVNDDNTSIEILNIPENLGTMLAQFEFDANIETAIKRKNGLIGQLYDYIKLKSILSQIRFEVYGKKLNEAHNTSENFASINVSLENAILTSEELMDDFKNKTHNEFIIILNSNFTSFTISNSKFEIKGSGEICSVIINNKTHSVIIDANIIGYFEDNHQSNESLSNYEFNLFISELDSSIISQSHESSGEIKISYTSESFRQNNSSIWESIWLLLNFCYFILLCIIGILFCSSSIVITRFCNRFLRRYHFRVIIQFYLIQLGIILIFIITTSKIISIFSPLNMNANRYFLLNLIFCFSCNFILCAFKKIYKSR